MQRSIAPILVRLRRKFSFAAGFRAGMLCPGEVYQAHDFRLHQSSALEQMRSDWERIGNDFRIVMGREFERATEGQGKAASGSDER